MALIMHSIPILKMYTLNTVNMIQYLDEPVISKKNSPLHGLTKGSLWNNITTGSDANVTVVTLFVLLHGEQNESLTSSSESIIDSLSEQVALTFVSFTNNALIVILTDEVEDEAVSRQEH